MWFQRRKLRYDGRMLPEIPMTWRALLKTETAQDYYRRLDEFLNAEKAAGRTILPAPGNIFHALEATPHERVRVLLLGQDPYPTPGHAHGLCFSVLPQVRPLPGSLKNIYKELAGDIPGFAPPAHGFLEHWAKQGILLLNTVLTVRAGAANSHQKRGWERFTDRIIALCNDKPSRVVFVLWGKKAQEKIPLITNPQQRIVAGAHPSPLSAKLFLGSRPFSQINRHLADAGQTPIDWQLPAQI
jgi:uracil-DNA glycosylase